MAEGPYWGGQTAWAYLDVDQPLIAWLVYRGELISADEVAPNAVSIFHTSRLRNAGSNLYETEIALERRRVEVDPNGPSRLRGFFAFPDRESAERAASRWRMPGHRVENLAQIEVHPDARVANRDSEFITRRLAYGPGPWMDRYLLGDTYEDPRLPELVIEGRAVVHDVPLRERAKRVVHGTWPEASWILELGRIGVELGADVGHISAWVVREGERFQVRYHISAGDLHDPEFLDQLAAYRESGRPIDWQGLRPFLEDRAKVPDLRDQEFVLE